MSKNGTVKILEGTNEQSEVLDDCNEEGKLQMGSGRLLSESMTGRVGRSERASEKTNDGRI